MINYDDKKVKEKLEQYVNTCNVNILIGAGFSTPSLPDMNKITIIFKEIINSLKKKSVDDLKNKFSGKEFSNYFTNQQYTDINKSIEEIYSYFNENINENDYDKILNNLEKIDSNFEAILYESSIEKVLNKSNKNNLSNCFIFLFFKIFKIIKIKEEYDENIIKIQELIKWLFKKNELHIKRTVKDTINIFTTNYDTLIEEALEKSKYYYYNGFHGSLVKQFDSDFYDYSYFDNMNLNKNFYQVKKSIFNLYKLHGSVTWEITKNKDEYKLTEVGIKDDINLTSLTNYPHIIYPSIEKYDFSLNYEHYYELLRKFKDVLYKEDSCLLVFGFSLKDNHIWNIINNALSKGKIAVFIFTSEDIINKEKKICESEVSKNFRKDILNTNGINFICVKDYNFSDFFKDLNSGEDNLEINNKVHNIKNNSVELDE